MTVKMQKIYDLMVLCAVLALLILPLSAFAQMTDMPGVETQTNASGSMQTGSEETAGTAESILTAPAQGDLAVPEETAGVPPASQPPYSGLYYDSHAVVPGADMAGAVGPRKVDPRYEPAQKYIVVEKTRNVQSREANLTAANRALKLGRYAAAVDMFDALYQKNRRDPRIVMGLAVSQQRAGFTESAIGTYEEMLRMDPDNTDALVNMMGLLRQKYPSVALRRLLELKERYPQNPGIAAQLALTSAELGNYPEAMRNLGIAAGLEPDNAGHLYNMAVIADRQGATKDAINYYEKALETDTTYGGGRSIPRDTIYDRLAKLRRH